MAVGDAAAAAGLTTYTSAQNASLGYQNDNQNADYIAADRARLTTLEKTVGTPKFSASVSTNGQNIPADKWTLLVSGAFRTPDKNTGFQTWNGTLTVKRSGVYSVHAHVQFRDNDFGDTGVQVTRNTTAVDSSLTVASHEFQVQRPVTGSNTTQSNDAIRLMVPLVAGDVLRVYVIQRNVNGNTVNLGKYPHDLTFEAVWMDEL